MTSWPIGVTARGGATRGVHPAGPLLHAATRRPASLTGRNVLALCGTSILPSTPASIAGRFDPDAKRACPGCCKVYRHELARRSLPAGSTP